MPDARCSSKSPTWEQLVVNLTVICDIGPPEGRCWRSTLAVDLPYECFQNDAPFGEDLRLKRLAGERIREWDS